METIIILIFILGYLTITVEHPLKLNKSIPALLMAAIMWGLLAIGFHQDWFGIVNSTGEVFTNSKGNEGIFDSIMLHHFGKTSEILIFLIGAMTIVETIDLHNGFGLVKRVVHTTKKRKLLWIVGVLAFFLSAVIDNLTTTIVMITILRKLIHKRKERLWFASLIVIVANAGGAWSPIGDVTTTMLWIGDKVTTLKLIEFVFIPSLVCFIVPVTIASFLPVFKGNIDQEVKENQEVDEYKSSKTMLFVGVGGILTVPITKTLFHLPPYLGMLFALSILWFVAEYIKPKKEFSEKNRHKFSVPQALSKIDMSSILFFLGILMAVAAMGAMVFGTIEGNTMGTLRYLAETLENTMPSQNLVIIILGAVSAIVDNVPLVAATMGMYDMSVYPIDSFLWHFIAYSAGTGGSMLIIGSAAGVAAMGMENIDFIWYLKKISWLALIGFLAGAGVFLGIEFLF